MTTETAPAPVTETAPAADAAATATDAAASVPAADPVATTDAATTAVTTTDPSIVTDAAHSAAHHAPAFADIFHGIGANVIYLMGFSFILGSLFTVLILVLLDYLRRNKA